MHHTLLISIIIYKLLILEISLMLRVPHVMPFTLLVCGPLQWLQFQQTVACVDNKFMNNTIMSLNTRSCSWWCQDT